MAVTAVSVRNHANTTDRTFRAVGTLTLSGTYATGGFTANLNPNGSTPGSSQLPSRQFTNQVMTDFYSPTGYTYRVVSGPPNAAVIKIFSASGTELANGTAVPDASVVYRTEFTKFAY